MDVLTMLLVRSADGAGAYQGGGGAVRPNAIGAEVVRPGMGEADGAGR